MKTPRANRRRRTPRRRQRGGATDEEMGFHLGSDVLHDFGALYKNFPVVYYHTPTKSQSLGITPKEDDVVLLFDGNEDIKNRKLMNIKFTVPKNTSVFGSWTPPNLTGVENGSVGIVYDAGDKITKQLGARNVITFGSVLDPSKKPVLVPDDPIWFDVGAGTSVNIPLTMFGFDHTKITFLEIANFTGSSTCAFFHTPPDKRIDAIRVSNVAAGQPGCTSKPINESRASKVGYFVSIKEAKDNVAKLLVNDNPVNNQQAMFYLAGKTLGDTMLVASCMDKFGLVPNLFHLTNVRRQIGEAGAVEGGVWKTLSGGAIGGLGPSTLILKTQDRLNHTRALIMNVPSILQSKFEYTFVPGSIKDAQKVELYTLGYARLRTGLANRYDELIKSLDGRLRGMVDAGKVITGGIAYTFKDEFKKGLANNLIDKIVRALESIRDGVIAAYDRDEKGPPAGEEVTSKTIKPFYENIYKKYNKLAPATTSIFDDEGSLERHIVVSLGGGVIPKKLMIDFMTDFQGITKAPAGGPIEWVIKGDASKLLEQTGESMMVAAAPVGSNAASHQTDAPMMGGAEFDMTAHFQNLETMFLKAISTSEEDRNTVANYKSAKRDYEVWIDKDPDATDDSVSYDINEVYVGGFSVIPPPSGGDGEEPAYPLSYPLRDNAGTLLNDFIKYASRYSRVRAHMFVGGAKTIDNMLWSELLADYKHVTKKECIETKDAQNHMTVLFNAFVCHINATNSMLDNPGFDMNYADLAIAVDDKDYTAEMALTTMIADQIRKRLRAAAKTPDDSMSGNESNATLAKRAYDESDTELSPEDARKAATAATAAALEEALQNLADSIREFERAKTYEHGESGEGGVNQAGLEMLFKKVQAAYREYNKRMGRDEKRTLEEGSKDYSDLLGRFEIGSVRRGGTRRKKRAGTYRKKRKDKGTL
jgi:hypothetical protein